MSQDAVLREMLEHCMVGLPAIGKLLWLVQEERV